MRRRARPAPQPPRESTEPAVPGPRGPRVHAMHADHSDGDSVTASALSEETAAAVTTMMRAQMIEISELDGNRIVDRILEVVSSSILVRTLVAKKSVEPGPVCSCVVGGQGGATNICVLRYLDTGFFHVIDTGASALLCVPKRLSAADFSRLLGRVLNVRVTDVPSMFSSVKLNIVQTQQIWAAVGSQLERTEVHVDREAPIDMVIRDSTVTGTETLFDHFYESEASILAAGKSVVNPFQVSSPIAYHFATHISSDEETDDDREEEKNADGTPAMSKPKKEKPTDKNAEPRPKRLAIHHHISSMLDELRVLSAQGQKPSMLLATLGKLLQLTQTVESKGRMDTAVPLVECIDVVLHILMNHIQRSSDAAVHEALSRVIVCAASRLCRWRVEIVARKRSASILQSIVRIAAQHTTAATAGNSSCATSFSLACSQSIATALTCAFTLVTRSTAPRELGKLLDITFNKIENATASMVKPRVSLIIFLTLVARQTLKGITTTFISTEELGTSSGAIYAALSSITVRPDGEENDVPSHSQKKPEYFGAAPLNPSSILKGTQGSFYASHPDRFSRAIIEGLDLDFVICGLRGAFSLLSSLQSALDEALIVACPPNETIEPEDDSKDALGGTHPEPPLVVHYSHKVENPKDCLPVLQASLSELLVLAGDVCRTLCLAFLLIRAKQEDVNETIGDDAIIPKELLMSMSSYAVSRNRLALHTSVDDEPSHADMISGEDFRRTAAAIETKFLLQLHSFSAVSLLEDASNGLNSLFRRIPGMAAVLNVPTASAVAHHDFDPELLSDNDPFLQDRVWSSAVEAATAYILAKALIAPSRSESASGEVEMSRLYSSAAQATAFIQHQWTVRLSVACGPQARKSILSAFHRMHCVICTCSATTLSKHARVTFWGDVGTVMESLHATVPSPSPMLSVWQNVLSVSQAMGRMNENPRELAPRITIAVAVVGIRATDRSVIHEQEKKNTVAAFAGTAKSSLDSKDPVPSAAEYLGSNPWDGHEEFFVTESPTLLQVRSPIRRRGALSDHVDANVKEGNRTSSQAAFVSESSTDRYLRVLGVRMEDMVLLSEPMRYIADLLFDERGRRSWWTLGETCFVCADAFRNCGVPESAVALFVGCGLAAIAHVSHRGADVAELQAGTRLSQEFAAAVFTGASIPIGFRLLSLFIPSLEEVQYGKSLSLDANKDQKRRTRSGDASQDAPRRGTAADEIERQRRVFGISPSASLLGTLPGKRRESARSSSSVGDASWMSEHVANRIPLSGSLSLPDGGGLGEEALPDDTVPDAAARRGSSSLSSRMIGGESVLMTRHGEGLRTGTSPERGAGAGKLLSVIARSYQQQ